MALYQQGLKCRDSLSLKSYFEIYSHFKRIIFHVQNEFCIQIAGLVVTLNVSIFSSVSPCLYSFNVKN